MAPIHDNSSLRFLVFLSWVVLLGAQPSHAQTLASGPDAFKRMSLEELMDLDVTSAAKQAEPYWQADAALQVITGDQVRRSGATNLPEALRLADNLHVAQKGSHGWAISARGFNTDFGNKLLVLVDGRSIYTPLFSGVFWDAQDIVLSDLDRIEVISGPGGTLWGANAVNGVINITSKRARDTQGTLLVASEGSEALVSGTLRYGGQLAPDAFFRVHGKYFDRDGAVFPDGSDAGDDWRMGRGGFRVDIEPSAEEILTFQGDHYGGEAGQAVGGVVKLSGGNLLGRWSSTSSTGSGTSLQLYYDRTYLYLPKPANAFAPAGVLVDNIDTFDLDFQNHFDLDEGQAILWGLGYRFIHDAVQNAPSVAFDPPVLDHHLFSAFLQDEVALGRDLFFTAGSKIEHNDYTGFEFEPSARLKWVPAEGQMLWTAVSRAVRMPSRVDRDERVPTPLLAPTIENLLIGGADFRSETLIAYELGYRAQLTPELSSSLSTFFNVYDDIRSVEPAAPPNLLQFANGLQAQTYGAELSLDFQALEEWRLHVGYVLLQETVWVSQGETDFSNALNETADPQNQLFLRSSMGLGPVELDAALRWVDSFIFNDDQTPGTVPEYWELDARLGWRAIPGLEFSLVAQAVLNDQHAEYVISGSDPREEIQRSIHGKVTVQF